MELEVLEMTIIMQLLIVLIALKLEVHMTLVCIY